MTSHTTIPKVSTLEVIQTGSRRRWTSEEKLRIVAESVSAPRAVSSTARRYGLSSGQLFNWRRLVREGLLTADRPEGFMPAMVVDDGAGDDPASGVPHGSKEIVGRMVIALAGGRRIIVGRDVDVAVLGRVIEVVERS